MIANLHASQQAYAVNPALLDAALTFVAIVHGREQVAIQITGVIAHFGTCCSITAKQGRAGQSSANEDLRAVQNRLAVAVNGYNCIMDPK